jgi:hypothetical protein
MPDLLLITNQFVNGTPADGDEVNENFTDVKDYVDARLGNASSGQVLVANASGVITPRTMSGDATLSNTGVLTLAADSVGNSELAAASVDTGELVNSSVTTAKIADANVTSRKLNLTINSDQASAQLGPLTTTYQDIPGMDTSNTVTGGQALIFATFDCQIAATSAGTTYEELIECTVHVQGAGALSPSVKFRHKGRPDGATSGVARASITGVWPIALSGGTYTIKGQAKVAANEADTESHIQAGSYINVVLLG